MSKNYNKNKGQKQVQKLPETMLDIVIPVYGRFDLLEKCLELIPNSLSSKYTLTIVDNASPEKAEADAFYQKHAKEISRVLRNAKNMGFPVACNLGVKRGISPLILFLNSDVMLSPNSLDILIKALMDDPKVAVAGMLLTFPENSGDLRNDIRPAGTLQHIGLEMDVRGHFIHMYNGWRADHFKVLRRRDSYAVTGAAMLVRRRLFEKVRGFDLNFGMGTYEDVDLCLTLRDIGYNVIVVPEAKAVHYTGATAEHYKLGFPLNNNYVYFVNKWKGKLNYTAWMYY